MRNIPVLSSVARGSKVTPVIEGACEDHLDYLMRDERHNSNSLESRPGCGGASLSSTKLLMCRGESHARQVLVVPKDGVAMSELLRILNFARGRQPDRCRSRDLSSLYDKRVDAPNR